MVRLFSNRPNKSEFGWDWKGDILKTFNYAFSHNEIIKENLI
jgi:hypothetical protein